MHMVCSPGSAEINFPSRGLFLLFLVLSQCKLRGRQQVALPPHRETASRGNPWGGSGAFPLTRSVPDPGLSPWGGHNREPPWKVNWDPLPSCPHWPRLTPPQQASDHLHRDGPPSLLHTSHDHAETQCAALCLASGEIPKHKRFYPFPGDI